ACGSTGRRPRHASTLRRRELAPSSWSASTPPAAAPSSYTGAAGAGGAAEAGEDAVGGVAPRGTTREFSESRTPGAADCAGASCAASDDAAAAPRSPQTETASGSSLSASDRKSVV